MLLSATYDGNVMDFAENIISDPTTTYRGAREIPQTHRPMLGVMGFAENIISDPVIIKLKREEESLDNRPVLGPVRDRRGSPWSPYSWTSVMSRLVFPWSSGPEGTSSMEATAPTSPSGRFLMSLLSTMEDILLARCRSGCGELGEGVVDW